MAVSSYEVVKVRGDFVTASLLVWRRYKRPAPGIIEKLLEANPEIAGVHRTTPFLPNGMLVAIPIDLEIMNNAPTVGPSINLYGPNATGTPASRN